MDVRFFPYVSRRAGRGVYIMNYTAMIRELEAEQMKAEVPFFEVGDTVKVHLQIIEGGKKRIQMFMGTVIARKGKGVSETFSMHRISYGEGMERVFKLHSPLITNIEVVRKGKVRRAKLYYLRGTSGKASKVKQRIMVSKKKSAS